MYNKFLFYMGLGFFLSSYSSDQHKNHHLSQDDLSELQRAEYHKRRLGMPTPQSFGQLQVETPLEHTKLTYLEEWLNDSLRLENELYRLGDHRGWIESLQIDLWENLLNQEKSKKSQLLLQQARRDGVRAGQSLHATNKQVVG